jgi:hypothetical protein
MTARWCGSSSHELKPARSTRADALRVLPATACGTAGVGGPWHLSTSSADAIIPLRESTRQESGDEHGYRFRLFPAE